MQGIKKRKKWKNFINLHQASLSVQEHFLKFIMLSKYVSSLVLTWVMKSVALWRVSLMILWKNVVRQCFTMTWAFLFWWCMLKKLRRVVLSGKIGMQRGQGSMMEVFLRVSVKSKTNQSLIRDSPTKFFLISQRITRIGFLTLSLNREKVVVHKVRNLIVPNVARSTCVSV